MLCCSVLIDPVILVPGDTVLEKNHSYWYHDHSYIAIRGRKL